MRLTRKAEYAIRAMVDLAANYHTQPVMSKEIAARQDIPANFLIQIIPELKSSGLIHTARGNGGGIYLSKEPSEVSMKDIIEAIEGPIALNQCLAGDNHCSRKPTCPAHVAWNLAQIQMLSVLEATTLSTLTGSMTNPARGRSSNHENKVGNEVEIEIN